MRTRFEFKPLWEYISTLVHPSAHTDALTLLQHRRFIGTRLMGGLAALCTLPIYLAITGVPTLVDGLIFAWLLVPVLSAAFLSKTGNWPAAHLISVGSLAGLVTSVASITGGISSFVIAWLIVVPLEAALSSSRKVMITGTILAIAAAVGLTLTQSIGLLPPSRMIGMNDALLQFIGLSTAGIYVLALALGAENFERTGRKLRALEEARYLMLAQNSTDLITRHGRNGAILFASPAAERVLNTPARTLNGQGLFDRVHVADRPLYMKLLSDTAASCAPSSGEIRLRHDEKGWIWANMNCRPVPGTQTEYVSDGRQVITVITDITDKKLQSEQIETARTEAEHANIAKSKFLATMSHELRTPLNAIIGFSEMLLNEGALKLDQDRRHEYAHLIHESGEHLLSVVNGILDMSKIEAGKFDLLIEPFDVKTVITNSRDLLALKAQQQGVSLNLSLNESLPEISGDKRAIKQILLNLLANAIKFTDAGGRITLGATRMGNSIKIYVEDTGIGITKEDLEKIGTPFFQAKGTYDRPHEGTGLGLSVVKGLVDLHKGRLEISSEIGMGTRVDVILPVEQEKPQATITPAATPSTLHQQVSSDREVKKRA